MVADLKLLNTNSDVAQSTIDPLAVVHPGATLGPGCRVDPFAVVGDGVTLGANCVVHSHGVITGPTVLGDENQVFPFACVGGEPQDLRHKGERTALVVGARNTFREHVTVGRGTVHGGGITRIGDNNLIMAYCHIAHDCILGNNIVMANHATLAGHVHVHDYAVFGGMVAVGSFLRIGESAMLGAGSMLERDVPPFCMVSGDRARLHGTNRVGLKRRGFSTSAKVQIKEIVKDLKTPGLSIATIIDTHLSRPELSPEAERMITFLKEISRGVTR